ncbi:MAG: hypothetical protein V2J07_04405 [Anaerolineae bacterium]|jgi:hypothetical protein|nr:hypothetical protein [Anaerolineae bacterium]
MTKKATREEILNQYVAGKISMEEADELLQNVEMGANQETLAADEVVPVNEEKQTEEIPPELKRYRFFWLIPFLIGLILTLWGGFGIYNQFTRNGLSFGFWMAFIPLFLGVAIITLSVSSSKGHWIHVRINTGQDEWPRKISLSFPLPIFLLKLGGVAKWSWDVDGFGDGKGKILTRDLLEALENSDQPLVINVDEGKEKVKVIIW